MRKAGGTSFLPKTSPKSQSTRRAANCEEFSATAYTELKKIGSRPVIWDKLVNGDHTFVLIGEGPSMLMDDEDLKKSGNSLAVCDAWDKAFYMAPETPKRLPLLNKEFKAMVQRNVPF
jgi:hypothetical protein